MRMSSNFWLAGALLLSGTLLSACGDTGAQNASLAHQPLQAQKARVKITRIESVIASGAAARVRMDGQEIASIGTGGSTMLDVAGGSHKIVVDDPFHPNVFAMTFDAKPGMHYTLEIAPRGAAIWATAGFGLAGMLAESAINENGGVFQVRVADAKPASS